MKDLNLLTISFEGEIDANHTFSCMVTVMFNLNTRGIKLEFLPVQINDIYIMNYIINILSLSSSSNSMALLISVIENKHIDYIYISVKTRIQRQ